MLQNGEGCHPLVTSETGDKAAQNKAMAAPTSKEMSKEKRNHAIENGVSASQAEPPSRESRRRRSGNLTAPGKENEAGGKSSDSNAISPSNAASKKPKKTRADFEDMNWVCAECKEAECLMEPTADQFLLCDGICNRVFHFPCAGLSQVPASDEDWICKDCLQGRHQCAFCHEYGVDNVEVYKCKKDECGLFFHESCLSLNNVEVKMEKLEQPQENVDFNSGENSASLTVPVFTCPAHNCWTCTQKDALKKEREEQLAAAAIGRKTNNKRSKKKKQSSIYQCKTESRLFRCLYCPWAFHATCIPPMSKFHELAVLCHEHSLTHKLPDLDLSTSFQGTVEDKIDRHMLRMDGANRRNRKRKFGGGKSANPFFPGLRGDRLYGQEALCLEQEKDYMNNLLKLREEVISPTLSAVDEVQKDESSKNPTREKLFTEIRLGANDLRFCLPCDIKNEVHSKPPTYTHLNGLKYDPNNRPKRIPPSGERCQCQGSCGEQCFNRMTLIECYGDGGPSSNCGVGGQDCGNRAMGKRQFVKCKPKRETGKGWGLVTLENIPKGKLVLEYVGEVINEADKDARLVNWSKEHPNDPNFYVMGLGGGWYMDARECANMSRFINHSCDPNCLLMTMNVKGYKRNGIYAKQEIKAGEFLSYDYHFDTKHADKFLCRCGAKNCRGTMKGGGGLSSESKKPLSWKDAKARYDNDCKQLVELQKKQVSSLVSAVVPAAEQPNEHVFAGPQTKHRDSAIRNRIFLWRNAQQGADFVARNSRLEAGKSPPSLTTTTNKTQP